MSDPLPPVPASTAERAEALVAKGVFALPPRVRRRLAGPAIVRDGNRLDLDTQLLIKLDERAGTPPLMSPELPLGEMREQMAAGARTVGGRSASMSSVRALVMQGGAGPIDARLYVPHEAAADPRPSGLLVFFHGGGFIAGDLDTHDAPCRLLAHTAGMRVLSVAYRLAPENPYPAAVEDALSAFRDAVARAHELGADPARVAVGGDSAGGHLAAVVAQLSLLEGGGPVPAFQLLIYPTVDLAEERPSRVLFETGFLLERGPMEYARDCFLGTEEHDRLAPAISPIYGQMEGLPPAMVVTCGFDPLRDEGEEYARRLSEAGVRVLARRHAGSIHGFINILALGPGPRQAVSEMGGVLRASLATGDV